MDTQNGLTIDPNDPKTTEPTPGGLSFVPTTPEGKLPLEIVPPKPASSEQLAPEKKQETVLQPEVETNFNKNTPQNPQSNKSDVVLQGGQQKPTQKVVDKTKETTRLHHIEHPKDNLTSIADDEEEKFIKEVETVHGHK